MQRLGNLMKTKFLLFFSLLISWNVFASPVIDFPVKPGLLLEDSLAHGEKKLSMLITNTGTDPLNIKKFRPSCACTKVSPDAPLTIASGETNTFLCTLDLSGELKKGPKNYTVYIESDDPEKPVASWYVTVPIIPCVELHPKQLSFMESDAPTQTVTVIQHFREPVSPLHVYFLEDLFGAPPEEDKKPEKFLSFRVEEPLDSITNRITVFRIKDKTYSRYGSIRISVDAGCKFNILRIDTPKFPKPQNEAEAEK